MPYGEIHLRPEGRRLLSQFVKFLGTVTPDEYDEIKDFWNRHTIKDAKLPLEKKVMNTCPNKYRELCAFVVRSEDPQERPTESFSVVEKIDLVKTEFDDKYLVSGCTLAKLNVRYPFYHTAKNQIINFKEYCGDAQILKIPAIYESKATRKTIEEEKVLIKFFGMIP